jgi:hypothetical protein
MILINFSHPLTDAQIAQIERLHGKAERVISVPIQFDHARSFVAQWRDTFDGVALTSREWKTESFLVVLPSFNYVAALTMAELYGRMGYFPLIVRLKPVEGATPPRFEAAEIMDTQGVFNLAHKAG